MDCISQPYLSSHQQVYVPPPLLIRGSVAHPQPQPLQASKLSKTSTPRKRKQNNASTTEEEEQEEYIPNVPESFYSPNPGGHQFSVPIYQLKLGAPSVYRNTGFFEYPLQDTTQNWTESLAVSTQPRATMIPNYPPPSYNHGGYRVCAPVKDHIGVPPQPPLASAEADADSIELDTTDIYKNEEKRQAKERFNLNNNLMTVVLDDLKVNCETDVVTQERLELLQGFSKELIKEIEKEKIALEETEKYCAFSRQSFMVSTAKFNAEVKRLSKPISEGEFQAMVDKHYHEMKEQLMQKQNAIFEKCNCEEEIKGHTARKFESGDEHQSVEPFKISQKTFDALYQKEMPQTELSNAHSHIFNSDLTPPPYPCQPGSVQLATGNQYYRQHQEVPPPKPSIMQGSIGPPISSAPFTQQEHLQASKQKNNRVRYSEKKVRQRKQKQVKEGKPLQNVHSKEKQHGQNMTGLATTNLQQAPKLSLSEGMSFQNWLAEKYNNPGGATTQRTELFPMKVGPPTNISLQNSIVHMSGGGIVEIVQNPQQASCVQPSTSAPGIGPISGAEEGSAAIVRDDRGYQNQEDPSSVDVGDIPVLIQFLQLAIKDGKVISYDEGSVVGVGVPIAARHKHIISCHKLTL